MPTAHTSGSDLGAVSCASTTTCAAVGKRPGATSFSPLVANWAGNEWALTTAPSPPGNAYATLGGVACTTSDRCEAVGWYSPTPSNVDWFEPFADAVP
jgi:hypothetical protein